MADRPIIFSAPMVRALLDGRKTQTRRVLKPQPGWARDGVMFWRGTATMVHGHRLPYAVGDRLWCREAWNITHRAHLAPGETIERTEAECTAANGGFAAPCGDGVVYSATGAQSHPEFGKALWRPSIRMPRWASRLTLTVTDVRVQRLQEISEEDARAEGLEWVAPTWGVKGLAESWNSDPRLAFAALWNSLHGPDAWQENPWVCAVTFTVGRRNIDAGAG